MGWKLARRRKPAPPKVFKRFDPDGGNIGAGDRIRTGDIDLGKVALYQLSYSRPEGKPIVHQNIPSVKRSL